MIRKTILQTLLIFSFLSCYMFLQAQTNGKMYVKTLKPTYEWDEKVTIEFSGLPKRDAYSNAYNNLIVVPVGTPDEKYGEGQRVIVSKPGGKEELFIPQAGVYEVRLYLYEKPGIASARSSAFRILSVDEGQLDKKSDDAVMQIAMRNRIRNKELMCRAITEYFRRDPSPAGADYKGMKALQGMCSKPADKPVMMTTGAIYPIKARYQCYRIMSTGNQVSEDIYIIDNKQYKTMNKTGNYTYDPKTRILTFTSGPLYLPSQQWVAVYTAKGEPTNYGGKTVDAIIEIRRKADVDAGNRKVLQQCSCAQ